MSPITRRTIAAGLLLLPAAVMAGDGSLSAADAWTRPGLPNRPAAIYLTVSNATAADARLTGASSPAFERIEMHLSAEADGVMTMQPVASVDIEPGGMAMFEPGGLHLMAFGPAEPFSEGQTFPLTLTFENAAPVGTTVTVMPMTHGAGHGGHDEHSGS